MYGVTRSSFDLNRLMNDLSSLHTTNFFDTFTQNVTSRKNTYLKITGSIPKVDIIDQPDDNQLKIIFDVHGYDKDDLKLVTNAIDNKLILTTGKLNSYDEALKDSKDSKKSKKGKDVVQEEQKNNYIMREIKRSTNQRVIEFPDQLDLKTIKSEYVDGYLICTIKYLSEKENETEITIL